MNTQIKDEQRKDIKFKLGNVDYLDRFRSIVLHWGWLFFFFISPCSANELVLLHLVLLVAMQVHCIRLLRLKCW